MLGWLRRHAFVLIGGAALLGYYLWTVSSSGDPLTFSSHDPSYYNQLGDSFLAGKLHLLRTPPPQLLHLPNPYDPVANAPYRAAGIHDMSLYHGRLYLYWGPAPVLLLYLPFRLLGLGEISDPLAVALFAFIGTCFAVALLRYLTRRYLPKTPSWMLAAGTVAVVMGSALPFTLRRAAIYEAAICAGYCLAFAGLYLLVTSLLERPYRPYRLAIASLCFALAVGSRTTMILPALLPVAALAWILLRERPETRRGRIGITAALLGPLAVCAVLLAAYNVLRFGSVTEFGQHYQLAGADMTKRTFGSFSYVLPGSWFYLLARAHITAAFPFFHLPPPPISYPSGLPSSYDGLEPVGGILSNVPIALLAFFSWLAFRAREDRILRRLAATLALLGAAMILLLSYTLWGATMRYEVDFASLLLIPAVLTWFAFARATSRPLRRLVKTAGAAAIAWGVLFGLATGMTGYYDSLLTAQPGTYEFLERATAPLATAIVWLEGSGAQVVRVDPPTSVTTVPNPPGLQRLSLALSPQPAVLYLVAPGSGSYRLAAQPDGGVWRAAAANLCTNTGFESNTKGWTGFNGDETLTRVTANPRFGSRALRVGYPNADLQGTVYNTARGQAIPGGIPVTTSVWMKGTRGAKLEMQVRIVNSDGSSSGTITSFTATGRWQRNSATVSVNPGETGDVVQILALRRYAAGSGSFLVDGAAATATAPPARIYLTAPGAGRQQALRLGALRAGVELHLNSGLSTVTLSADRSDIVLGSLTLARSIG